MSPLTRRMQKVIAPLRRSEESQTIKTVEARLAEMIPPDSRFHLFPPRLSIEKPAKRQAIPARHVRLSVADYGNRRMLDFILDGRGKLVRVEEYRDPQPALDHVEIGEARRIADRDARIARLAKLRDVFVSDFAPEGAFEPGARIAGLRYVRAKRAHKFELLAKVTVDLSEGRLVDVEAAEGLR
ncbi:MAG: hypothetical protein HYR60_23660 [Acidobacteria bacterium]|nr:hypothetical protein [Acidobacteriota bacterium]MBI3470483.1 hypothetical protein [Candidatus Solibacter usitatus]